MLWQGRRGVGGDWGWGGEGGIKIGIGVGAVIGTLAAVSSAYLKGVMDGYYGKIIKDNAKKVAPENEEAVENFMKEELGNFKYTVFKIAEKEVTRVITETAELERRKRENEGFDEVK